MPSRSSHPRRVHLALRLPSCPAAGGLVVRSRFARYVSRSLVALLVLPTLMAIGAPSAVAAGFAPGNLVVVRVGTGSGALSSAAAPVFLDEYTPAGSLVQTIPMP